MVVELQGGLIHAVGPAPHDETGWLSAGLIDLQVNGFAGHDLNGGSLTVQTVHDLALAMLACGVTTFLPTLITASEARLTQALAVLARARRALPLVARMVPYVHVEGPAIAPEDGPRGAHPAAHVRAPDLQEFHRWQAASDGLVGMVTVSPHWPQAPTYIAALVAAGVHVALGHTDASAAQITAAVDAGARLSTHLGNGLHAQINRRRSPLWSQLVEDRLCASYIADGHHLSDQVLKVMLRAKGLERSLIVSDATAIGGLPPGRYDASIGGAVSLSADGRLSPNDGSGEYLAGAALPLFSGVATLMRQAGLGLGDALMLATRNPGRWVGGRGVLAPGQRADLVRFEFAPDLPGAPRVTGVWAGGVQMV
ncbi:MAG: amidohydrolase family protein [Rhodoferax sp.]|nr:amidohydrolase family protein [Rhodoferax sp.]